MGKAYRVHDQNDLYFITLRVVAWVDIFTRPCYRISFVDSLNYCIDNKGLNVHAWVIMSNHVHAVISAEEGNLTGIIRDLKSFTSKKFINQIFEEYESRRTWMLFQFRNRAMQKDKRIEYKVWESGYHGIELLSNTWIDTRINYIHNNPVKADIVDEPWHYKYSSARDYIGKEGLVRIDPLL